MYICNYMYRFPYVLHVYTFVSVCVCKSVSTIKVAAKLVTSSQRAGSSITDVLWAMKPSKKLSIPFRLHGAAILTGDAPMSIIQDVVIPPDNPT